MTEKKSLEVRVSVDVGNLFHSVAIGLPDGRVLEEFEIRHRPEGFGEFFSRIERHCEAQGSGVAAHGLTPPCLSHVGKTRVKLGLVGGDSVAEN